MFSGCDRLLSGAVKPLARPAVREWRGMENPPRGQGKTMRKKAPRGHQGSRGAGAAMLQEAVSRRRGVMPPYAGLPQGMSARFKRAPASNAAPPAPTAPRPRRPAPPVAGRASVHEARGQADGRQAEHVPRIGQAQQRFTHAGAARTIDAALLQDRRGDRDGGQRQRVDMLEDPRERGLQPRPFLQAAHVLPTLHRPRGRSRSSTSGSYLPGSRSTRSACTS